MGAGIVGKIGTRPPHGPPDADVDDPVIAARRLDRNGPNDDAAGAELEERLRFETLLSVLSARYERLLAVMEASARPPVLRYHTVSGSKGLEYLQAVRLGAAACPPARDAAVTDRP